MRPCRCYSWLGSLLSESCTYFVTFAFGVGSSEPNPLVGREAPGDPGDSGERSSRSFFGVHNTSPCSCRDFNAVGRDLSNSVTTSRTPGALEARPRFLTSVEDALAPPSLHAASASWSMRASTSPPSLPGFPEKPGAEEVPGHPQAGVSPPSGDVERWTSGTIVMWEKTAFGRRVVVTGPPISVARRVRARVGGGAPGRGVGEPPLVDPEHGDGDGTWRRRRPAMI
jgi:hypothetical protein